jgi:hypothetical protein
MHAEAFAFVQRWVVNVDEGARPTHVIEIGSRDVNGSVRPLFVGCNYLGIDAIQGPGVDVVADGALWQPTRKVDLVICLETLEHSPVPQMIVWNALRMLKPSGTLIVTAASHPRTPHSGIDGGPLRENEYYGNINECELMCWLNVCRQISVEKDFTCGDVRAIATL